MTNFHTFPHRETYAKLILLRKKAIFYHKIFFLQQLETTSPIGLFGCSFANPQNFISISAKSWYICIFYISIHFCMVIVQNSTKIFAFLQILSFLKNSPWNLKISYILRLFPLCMNEEKWKKSQEMKFYIDLFSNSVLIDLLTYPY